MNTPLKTVFIALCILGLGAAASSAQETAAGSFKLTHRSTFANASAHNPFWPIGWVKGDTSTQSESTEPTVPISESNFTVTSISTGVNPQATINGKIYGEGETIIAMYGGQKIKIVLVAVNDGEVVLQYLGKNYKVQMKHPELHMHESSNDDDALLKKQDNVLILR